jgi:hypothetical protein
MARGEWEDTPQWFDDLCEDLAYELRADRPPKRESKAAEGRKRKLTGFSRPTEAGKKEGERRRWRERT